jgi:hypothetical protein
MDGARFSAIPADAWPRIRLTWHPAMGLVASSWPILDVWETRQRRRESIHVELAGRPQRVLVRRQGFEVRCELVTPAQYRLLEALQDGATLGASCQRLGARHPSETLPMAEWFSGWMRDGLIVGDELEADA